jgi:hypothetical protein
MKNFEGKPELINLAYAELSNNYGKTQQTLHPYIASCFYKLSLFSNFSCCAIGDLAALAKGGATLRS